jgi:L-histidine Nalpha-methyltransferase
MTAASMDTLVDPAFRDDVLKGFRDPARRAIPARWLYDRTGSELFEAITDLPEYYPTRTEIAILEACADQISDKIGHIDSLVEFGSGSSTKTPRLINAVRPSRYVPIDISGDFLRQSANQIAQDFPSLVVEPVEADFMHPIDISGMEQDEVLGFFPGSTIGNMIARSSVDLLRAMRTTLDQNAWLLIGMDRVKDRDVLRAAYDDSQGVTAAFNLNLLHRINRELDGTIPIEKFRHLAHWNELYSRIEMHLEATDDVEFTIGDERFQMGRGETIHTENSHKYGERDGRMMLRAGGWTPIEEWTDEKGWFALTLARAEPFYNAP